MVPGTIESYHQMYQIGLTVTLVLAGITVLLFFVFRINKIINDMAGITKRKELRLRGTGEAKVKKTMKKERLAKKTEKRKRKKHSGATEVLNAPGGGPTEVLNALGGSPTEVLNVPDGAEAKERQALEIVSTGAAIQKAVKASGTTERLMHAPDAGEIRITILQEIMYVHADEVIVV